MQPMDLASLKREHASSSVYLHTAKSKLMGMSSSNLDSVASSSARDGRISKEYRLQAIVTSEEGHQERTNQIIGHESKRSRRQLLDRGHGSLSAMNNYESGIRFQTSL